MQFYIMVLPNSIMCTTFEFYLDLKHQCANRRAIPLKIKGRFHAPSLLPRHPATSVALKTMTSVNAASEANTYDIIFAGGK
jgi:hypothetical protein